ncbi:MAG TPA: hypothetical protein VEB20_10390 [Azospirillaceae bacterium]|nr:hypothetical protein [Azospirillaceae bacterium]
MPRPIRRALQRPLATLARQLTPAGWTCTAAAALLLAAAVGGMA